MSIYDVIYNLFLYNITVQLMLCRKLIDSKFMANFSNMYNLPLFVCVRVAMIGGVVMDREVVLLTEVMVMDREVVLLTGVMVSEITSFYINIGFSDTCNQSNSSVLYVTMKLKTMVVI